MSPPIDANIYDLDDATPDQLRDEIMALQREIERAEAKAARWEEAFHEAERIINGMLKRGYTTDEE